MADDKEREGTGKTAWGAAALAARRDRAANGAAGWRVTRLETAARQQTAGAACRGRLPGSRALPRRRSAPPRPLPPRGPAPPLFALLPAARSSLVGPPLLPRVPARWRPGHRQAWAVMASLLTGVGTPPSGPGPVSGAWAPRGRLPRLWAPGEGVLGGDSAGRPDLPGSCRARREPAWPADGVCGHHFASLAGTWEDGRGVQPSVRAPSVRSACSPPRPPSGDLC